MRVEKIVDQAGRAKLRMHLMPNRKEMSHIKHFDFADIQDVDAVIETLKTAMNCSS